MGFGRAFSAGGAGDDAAGAGAGEPVLRPEMRDARDATPGEDSRVSRAVVSEVYPIPAVEEGNGEGREREGGGTYQVSQSRRMELSVRIDWCEG